MTRDYSQFFGETPNKPRALTVLETLGWQPFFAQQTDIDALADTPPVRVTEVHRSGLRVRGDGIDGVIPPSVPGTVGDWFLFNPTLPQDSVLLDRKSLMKRRAPGEERAEQLIAANIDTSFIVSSCNRDFNVARLERYIALAFEAEIDPVIVLTKVDLTDDADTYRAQAERISDRVPVVMLNAKGDEPVQLLAPWCKPSNTVAFLGSSGVGKSTLTNALLGSADILTQAAREDDARGRHTTTSRQLHTAPNGTLVLDTPGMRELQMTDVAAGIGELFNDLEELSQNCKFRDCAHETEPGCAVLAARDAGDIGEDRIARWKKLVTEDAHNSATIAQRRSKDKAFGKMVKAAMSKKKR